MIENVSGTSVDPPSRLAILRREFRILVLNCSASGCLFETNMQIEVGTVGSLCVTVEGRELVDDVRVVRCQPIPGAGSTYHVGAEFLWTRPFDARAIRVAFMPR